MSAIIVEDGTGIAGANAYVNLADADAYLVARNIWAATPVEPAPVVEDGEGEEQPAGTSDAAVVAAKEAAIIRAADALNVLKWIGEAKLFPDSLMAWPREDAVLPGGAKVTDDSIPAAVVRANIELAGLIYSGAADPLAPVERGGKIISKSESFKEGNLDVIGGDAKSYSVTYADAAPVETYLPAVYGLLRPYLLEVPGQGGMVFGRAVQG